MNAGRVDFVAMARDNERRESHVMPDSPLPDGPIDDLAMDHVAVETVRTGDARYEMRIRGDDARLTIEIWTTRRARIHVSTPESANWVRFATSADGTLESLACEACNLHFENFDRGFYGLMLNRADESFTAHLTAPGYIKTRVRPPRQLPTE